MAIHEPEAHSTYTKSGDFSPKKESIGGQSGHQEVVNQTTGGARPAHEFAEAPQRTMMGSGKPIRRFGGGTQRSCGKYSTDHMPSHRSTPWLLRFTLQFTLQGITDSAKCTASGV
jgi:hypothetical protein